MTNQEDRNTIFYYFTRPHFPVIKVFRYVLKRLSSPFILTVFILGFLSSTPAFAQPETRESFDLKLTTLEQQFDNQVFTILSNYFDRRQFFVDVHVEARVVDETYRTTQNQIVQGPTHNVIMPGLPYLPEENLQPQQQTGNEQTQTVINESTIQRLQILQLEVNIYADTSFTPQQIDFMRLLGGIGAKINENRGDIVNVYQVDMPDIDLNESRQIIEVTPRETLLGSVRDYIPGFALMILIGLTMLISKLTTGRNQPPANMRQRREQFRNELNYEPAEQSQPEPKKEESDKSESPAKVDFDFVTRQFLMNSKEVALLFEYWMENNPDKGAERAAKVVCTIDKHMVKALKNELRPEVYGLVADKVYSMEELSHEEKRQVASAFIQELKEDHTSQNTAKKHYQLDLFQFLDHVEDYQIAQLIAGEDKQSAALVVDYLSEEKSARMLRRFDKQQMADIMVGSSEISSLSYSDHKKISSRLFSKMMDILETEKELQHGLDNVLSLLEKLPVEDQQKYIEQLKTTGSPVGELVDKHFITIDEIPNISQRLLKEILEPISTETLLQALAGMSENIREHILSVRPKREQRLLRMELQTGDSIQSDQTELAKNKLMSRIRKALEKSKEF